MAQRVAVLDLNTRMSESDPKNNLEPQTPPIHVTAGPHRVSAAFINSFEAIADDLVMPLENTLADVSIAQGITLLPHMRELRIIGPSKVTGISDTPVRRGIFTCRPTSAAEEAPCARRIVERIATQAFRGPLTSDDDAGAAQFLPGRPGARRFRDRHTSRAAGRSSPARASCSASRKRRRRFDQARATA